MSLVFNTLLIHLQWSYNGLVVVLLHLCKQTVKTIVVLITRLKKTTTNTKQEGLLAQSADFVRHMKTFLDIFFRLLDTV